jgi:hypothetical protein
MSLIRGRNEAAKKRSFHRDHHIHKPRKEKVKNRANERKPWKDAYSR